MHSKKEVKISHFSLYLQQHVAQIECDLYHSQQSYMFNSC